MASAPRRRPTPAPPARALARSASPTAQAAAPAVPSAKAPVGPPCTASWKAPCCRTETRHRGRRPPEQAAPGTDALAPDIPGQLAPQDRHEVAHDDGLGCHGERLAVQAHLEQLHMSRQVQGLAADRPSRRAAGRCSVNATSNARDGIGPRPRTSAIDRRDRTERPGDRLDAGPRLRAIRPVPWPRRRGSPQSANVAVSKPRVNVASSSRSGTDVTSICRALDQDRRKRRLKPTATHRSARSASARIAAASVRDMAIGFSTSTCQPAARHRRARPAWVAGGVAISAASAVPAASASSSCAQLRMPGRRSAIMPTPVRRSVRRCSSPGFPAAPTSAGKW